MIVSGPKVMVKEMYPLAWSRGRTVHVRRAAAVSEEPLEVYSGFKSLRTLLGGAVMSAYMGYVITTPLIF